MRLLLLSLRLAWRQLRSGQLVPMALSVAVVTAVTAAMAGVVQRLQAGVLAEAAQVLAADFSVQSADSGVWALGAGLLAEIEGLRVSKAASSNSMMFSRQGRQLVSVKAVDSAYPLLGQVGVAPRPFADPVAVASGPPRGEAWLESRLFSRLQVQVGDMVELGDVQLRAAGVLVREPDRISGLGGLTPRVMVHLQDALLSGILAAGARANYKRMFSAPAAQIPALGSALEQEAGKGYELLSAHTDKLSPENDAARGVTPSRRVQRTLDNTRAALLLTTLVALLLALTAASMAARRYLDASLGQFAMLRAGGVAPGRLGLLFACTLFWGVAPGMALGAGLALLAQNWLVDVLARGFGMQLPPGDTAPLAFGVAVAAAGLAASFAPSLWALLRLSPVAIWQRSGAASQTGGQLLQWGPLGLLLAVLAVLYSSDLALSVSVLAGILAAGLWAWLAARLAMALAARALRLASGLLRSALASLVMRRASLSLQVMALALVLLPVLAVSGFRNILGEDWRSAFPADIPDHIAANMDEAEVQRVDAWLRGQGSGLQQPAKMMRVQLEITDQDGNLVRTRGVNLSTSQPLPPGNSLVAGNWWSGGSAVEISLEDEFAEEMGIRLGQQLRFRRDGQEFSAPVTSLRDIDWSRMTPNFWVLASPGLSRQLPATWLGSFRLPPQNKEALNEFVRLFPTVHLYEFDRLVEEARGVFQRVSALLLAVVAATLAASVLVLTEVLRTQLHSRRTEWALLRATGVPAWRIWAIAIAEFLFCGVLAGLAAALGAEALLYLLIEQGSEVLRYVRQPQLWWWGGAGGGLGVLLSVGWMAVPHLRARPMEVLRARDS